MNSIERLPQERRFVKGMHRPQRYEERAVEVGPLRYPARRAIPLNLTVSLIMIVAALLIREGALSLDVLLPVLPAIGALMGGAVTAAFVGASVAGRLSNAALERVIQVLLVSIGAALVVESFLQGGRG
jgi:uncharacterized protein